MLKKIFKTIGKIFLALILFITLVYGGFHLWERVTGGKYVKYLIEHSETIPLGETFDFDNLKEDIEKNELILFGEIHGFKEPIKFDVAFFKYLNNFHGVTDHLVEFDLAQANKLNAYMKSGNEAFLDDALKNWVVIQGRNNQDYRNKFVELHAFYQRLPDNKKFTFWGIDRIYDVGLFKEYVNGMLPVPKDTADLKELEIKELVNELVEIPSKDKENDFLFSQLKSNVNYFEEKMGRDEVMYRNFRSLYERNIGTGKKYYGLLGMGHVFLYRVNGGHVFASQVRKSDMGLEGKIMCINAMMNESKMVMESNQLPPFMQDEGEYTRMAISSDNLLFLYMVGVKDFKRMTPAYHKSLIKMNGENSPYGESMRLNTVIQLLPVFPVLDINDKGEDYFTHTLFIRHSDWATPIVE